MDPVITKTLQDKTDEELQLLHRRHTVRLEEAEAQKTTSQELLKAVEMEIEMRHLAGGFEQLKHFRARLDANLKRKGHCMHAPQCIGDGESDERDVFGCCNCGTRKKEQEKAT